VLADDSYAGLVSPFTMFDLDCATRKDRLACCDLPQGVHGTWTRFHVARRSNHYIN